MANLAGTENRKTEEEHKTPRSLAKSQKTLTETQQKAENRQKNTVLCRLIQKSPQKSQKKEVALQRVTPRILKSG